MPSHGNTMAARMQDEDPGLASGEVYMDPDTRQRFEDDRSVGDRKPTEDTAGDEAVVKTKKSPTYKAKLLFPGQKSPIGQFKDDGNRVTSRISMVECENWSSSVKIEIKALVSKDAPTPEHKRAEELLHTWVIRLNATCDVSDQPVVRMYPAAYMGSTAGDTNGHYIEKAFQDFCVMTRDREAITHRQMGRLGFLSLTFCPAKAHTEGILQEAGTLGNYQHVQDQLLEIFNTSNNATVKLSALFVTSESDSFFISYSGIIRAFALEKAFPPYTRWFNGLADAKCKVQKGQTTPRTKRPPVKIPTSYTYADSNECWTAEGMPIIYQEENDIEDIRKQSWTSNLGYTK